MIRAAAIVGAPLALSACTVLPYTDAPPATAFQPLDLPDRVFQSPEQAIDHYLAESGAVDADVTSEIGRDPYGVGTRLILVTAEGYEDDSVLGEQWRIAMAQTDIGLRVVQAGIRYNCARGPNPGWSRELCP